VAPHRCTGDDRGNGAAHRRGDGGVARRRRASGEAERWRTQASAALDRGGRDGGTVEAAARGARLSGRRTRGCRAAGGRGAVGSVFKLPRACPEVPPTAANQGSARRDAATDRRAPRVSQISNLNKSPG
jgi:hypothetical protein